MTITAEGAAQADAEIERHVDHVDLQQDLTGAPVPLEGMLIVGRRRASTAERYRRRR